MLPAPGCEPWVPHRTGEWCRATERSSSPHSVDTMAISFGSADTMSPYESRRWQELQAHWDKKAKRKEILPAKTRQALGNAATRAREVAGDAAGSVVERVPEGVKDVGRAVADAALLPFVHKAVHLVDLASDWAAELTDPDTVLAFHRDRGRDVETLKDLRAFDLEQCDELTKSLALRVSTFGAAEGAALGMLATVPVAGGLAAIGIDVVVTHLLSTAIASRATYAYGFDAGDPAERHMIDRMVRRSYAEQASKVGALRKSRAAFQAGSGRKNWSAKLRQDHKLMAAVEKLMKQAGGTQHIPVQKVTRAIPGLAIVAGAGSNAFMLGDVARQASFYAQTRFLAEKHGLQLPANLARDADED
jgi:hypothetical protein